jgi:hypothetical protein
MAQIHYLICYDTDTKKWLAADEALGAWFTDGYVWEGLDPVGDEFDGKWRHLNQNNLFEMDTEFECSDKVGEMLKHLNGEG